jgi:superfamily II DNA or RNA helicase
MSKKNIKLIHPFINKCPDIDELLLSNNEHGVVCTINSFCYKIKKLAAKYSDRIDENIFKGDALELFTEFMIKDCGSDNRIGIYDYKLVTDTDEEDVGVDGFGIGENENPATVQVKFRAGDYVLTANEDHLSNFLTSSIFDYNVKIEDKKNMLIVTTGLKVDENTLQKMLKGKVRVLNRDALRQMFDNRPEWWKRFYEAVETSRIKKENKQKPLTLRKHQNEAKLAIFADENQKGKIILPTGTGKTLVEAEIVREFIQKLKDKSNSSPIIKINSSRILLCFQLFEEVFTYLRSYGIEARYVNYNSGNKDDKEYAIAMRKEGWEYRKILSTTKYSEVKEVYDNCIKEKLPLIIFSTYHSSEKFAKSKLVPELTIHDEAHNLVSNNFYRVASLPSNADFFFTATEKITDSDEDVGMNNGQIFDNLIYSKSAKELIDEGEMVPPYLHVVRSSNDSRIDTDYEMMFESVIEAFNAHERKIKEVSYSAAEIGAKVLVVCRGQQDLLQMFQTKAIEHFRATYPNIHLFALSSDFGICNDGEFSKPPVTNIKKYKLLKRLKAMKNNEKALVFHVDMIGEGIDVPGITGIMPFRNCEEAKLIQNIGRSTRLHAIDRKRLYEGEISPNNKENWIKPYSWVIIPSYMIESEGLEGRFRFIIDRLRREFGYIPQQHTVIDNKRGLDDETVIDTVNDMNKKKKQIKSGVNAFQHEFEKLSCIEQIIKEEEIMQRKREILDSIVHGKNLTELEGIIDGFKEHEDKLYCKRESVGADAVGQVVKNGFMIFAKSKFRKDEVKSVPMWIKSKREELISKDMFTIEKDYMILKEDVIINSASKASSIVLGCSSNGLDDWKNKDSKKLGDILKERSANE